MTDVHNFPPNPGDQGDLDKITPAMPHSGNAPEEMREVPVEEHDQPLREDILVTPNSPAILTPVEAKPRKKMAIIIGSVVAGVAVLAAGIGIGMNTGKEKASAEPTAEAPANPGNQPSSEPSSQATSEPSTSPSAVPTPEATFETPLTIQLSDVLMPTTVEGDVRQPGFLSIAKVYPPEETLTTTWNNQTVTVPKLVDPLAEIPGVEYDYTQQDLGNAVASQLSLLFTMNSMNDEYLNLVNQFSDSPEVQQTISNYNDAFGVYRSHAHVAIYDVAQNDATPELPVLFTGDGTDVDGNPLVTVSNGPAFVRVLGDATPWGAENIGVVEQSIPVRTFSFSYAPNGDGTVTVKTLDFNVFTEDAPTLTRVNE